MPAPSEVLHRRFHSVSGLAGRKGAGGDPAPLAGSAEENSAVGSAAGPLDSSISDEQSCCSRETANRALLAAPDVLRLGGHLRRVALLALMLDSVRRSVRCWSTSPRKTWATFIGVTGQPSTVASGIGYAVGCMSSMRLPNGSVT